MLTHTARQVSHHHSTRLKTNEFSSYLLVQDQQRLETSHNFGWERLAIGFWDFKFAQVVRGGPEAH